MNIQNIANLVVRHILKMIENHNNAIIRLQFQQRIVNLFREFVVLLGLILHLVARMKIFMKLLNVLFPVELIDRFIDRNLVEPAEELVFRVVRIELLVHLHEDRLDDILGVFSARGKAQGQIVDRPLIAVDKRLKGSLIAIKTAWTLSSPSSLLRAVTAGEGEGE